MNCAQKSPARLSGEATAAGSAAGSMPPRRAAVRVTMTSGRRASPTRTRRARPSSSTAPRTPPPPPAPLSPPLGTSAAPGPSGHDARRVREVGSGGGTLRDRERVTERQRLKERAEARRVRGVGAAVRGLPAAARATLRASRVARGAEPLIQAPPSGPAAAPQSPVRWRERRARAAPACAWRCGRAGELGRCVTSA